MKKKKGLLLILIAAALLYFGGKGELLSSVQELADSVSAQSLPPVQNEQPSQAESKSDLDEGGSYTTMEDVALYLQSYGRLPDNFVTKGEARKAGWQGGGLENYLPGKCIGGDEFGNREGLLPEKAGREYYECDINTLGASERGAERIVYSDDGLIYYTSDHYDSFSLLYGEP